MEHELARQKAIEEAWGAEYKHCKRFLDKDGWLTINSARISDYPYQGFDHFTTIGDARVRPKSLHGLEDNNGWNKILTSEDLPKEDGNYFVLAKGNYVYSQVVTYYVFKSQDNFPEQEEMNRCWVDSFSHWRPIPPPLPNPIY